MRVQILKTSVYMQTQNCPCIEYLFFLKPTFVQGGSLENVILQCPFMCCVGAPLVVLHCTNYTRRRNMRNFSRKSKHCICINLQSFLWPSLFLGPALTLSTRTHTPTRTLAHASAHPWSHKRSRVRKTAWGNTCTSTQGGERFVLVSAGVRQQSTKHM